MKKVEYAEVIEEVYLSLKKIHGNRKDEGDFISTENKFYVNIEILKKC
jgi:hypothetical protein